MIRKLIVNDIRNNKLISASIAFFMGISAMLIGLSVLLFTGLLGSVDSLMETAQTPDFLQMHAGEIDEGKLADFADEGQDIEKWQICRFLNLENAAITLGDRSLADSTQDNGLCVQGDGFDYLVDLNNKLPVVSQGEIYVPACYMKEYGIIEGDRVKIGEETFTIGGFIRDSQMNSMMASSKRFLVCEEDYYRMEKAGVEEYLIEYKLAEESDVNAFSDAYMDAGLPANGPTITKPLVRMMNALSDGLMIFVILVAGVVVLLISMLCIRFILLTGLEKEKREIGMLKAIGLARQDIRRLYFVKFAALSAAGAVLGLLAAILISNPLEDRIQRLYGAVSNRGLVIAITVFGILLVELLILMSVRHTLKKMEKVSAVEALYGHTGFTGKRHARQYLLIVLVVAAGMFLMLIPQNISSTIWSEKFVTYMGIGDGELRLDVRQTDNIEETTKEITDHIEKDERVMKYTVLQTSTLLAELPDGSRTHLMVEQGNHSIFPVSYTQGREPKKKGEIALSVLNAEEMNLKMGDMLTISEEGKQTEYRICGIYSDITNGGKTAKSYVSEADEVMWSIFYVSLKDGISREDWMAEYQKQYGVEAVHIRDYVSATYGQTISQLRLASIVAAVAALAVILVVTVLFMRLLVERGRSESALRKALGFTSAEVRSSYFRKGLICTICGILAGLLCGNIFGERIAGAALRSLGASGFRFITDNTTVYILIPICVLLVTLAAVRIGISEIRNIKAQECME